MVLLEDGMSGRGGAPSHGDRVFWGFYHPGQTEAVSASLATVERRRQSKIRLTQAKRLPFYTSPMSGGGTADQTCFLLFVPSHNSLQTSKARLSSQ
jgi:hypothetical protein